MIKKLKTINPYDETEIQKINELVDAVNGLQGAFESIHPCFKYKDLNKIQDDPAENVLINTLCMNKEFAEEEMERLQKENSDLKDDLERTRKALDVAVDALNRIDKKLMTGIEMTSQARNALEEITAILENKNGNC